MRPLLISCLALAVAAGCAKKTETRAEAEQASLDTIEVTGSRVSGNALARQEQAAATQDRQRRAEAKARQAPQEVHAGTPPPSPPAPAMHNGYQLLEAPVQAPVDVNTENYDQFEDNGVVRTAENAVSTFSIDVDTGSYSNVRRMLAQGQLPPKDAVRVEEMINYFDYGYAGPADRSQPFRVSTELAPAPWDRKRLLMQVGIQGYDVAASEIPASNLVLLIDTSGSMADQNKLPLLKEAFRQMVPNLRAQDRVSIVVYAGSAGLVLPSTPGDRHGEILDALGRLEAGGSTNGGEGIELAYAMAKQGFIEGGVNRIVLATDGDFNVGTVDRGTLETWVADQRRSGIALSTLGFGQGNYHDAMAERLADAGDGNHAYIDTPQEARKVLVEQMQSTLLTIANDVKVQIEFNPALVAEYRLVGYENRILAREDFANDRVDAGDIGAGHEVTALYEIALAGSGGERLPPLRYGPAPAGGAKNGELAHLRLRYKLPGQERSRLVETPVLRSSLQRDPSESLRFATAVAGYADLLRGGGNVGDWDWDDVARTAHDATGEDRWGLRREFIGLVESASAVTSGMQQPMPAIAVE
jgi:Ca-activated chloride channel family protein